MTTAETTFTRLRDQILGYRRGLGDLIAGGGLWTLIVLFIVWAALDERDALVVGIVSGSILALGAVGLTLIYGVLKFGHFAHGDAMMMSAYVAFFFLFGHIVGARPSDDVSILPFTVTDLPGADHTIWRFSFGYGLLVAIVLSAVVMAALFIGIDRVIYRKLRQRKSGIVIFSIAALGLAIGLRSFVLLVYGPDPRLYAPGIRKRIDLPFDMHILADQLFIFCAAIAVTVVVYVILYRTKLGKAMRAMADNPDLARSQRHQHGARHHVDVGRRRGAGGGGRSAPGAAGAARSADRVRAAAAALRGDDPGRHRQSARGVRRRDDRRHGAGGRRDGAPRLHPRRLPGAGYKFSVAFIILIVILLLRPRGLFGAKQ